MSNEEFIREMQNMYESLKYFNIENNSLVLNYNGYYKIPLNYINLRSLNPNLFTLNPIQIFQVIYMLELIYKTEINENQQKFITEYTNNYLALNDQALENKVDDQNLVWNLSIPIYTSYDPNLTNNKSCQLIQNIINNHSNTIESGRGNQQRLVLSNPNIPKVIEDPLAGLEKAGFTLIALVSGAIIATCLFIAFFVIRH